MAYKPRRGSVVRRSPPQPVPPPRHFFAHFGRRRGGSLVAPTQWDCQVGVAGPTTVPKQPKGRPHPGPHRSHLHPSVSHNTRLSL